LGGYATIALKKGIRTLPLTSPGFILTCPSQLRAYPALLRDVIELNDVVKGLSAQRKVIGQPVYNDKNQKIGEVEDIIISPGELLTHIDRCPKRWCKSAGHGLSSMLARAVAQAAAMRRGLALRIGVQDLGSRWSRAGIRSGAQRAIRPELHRLLYSGSTGSVLAQVERTKLIKINALRLNSP
jgi:hypothetical protein